ncbi:MULTISPECIES: sugar phosphate isomerase/epimerase family protein [Lacticaseibacillus]|uniref:Protein iolH n=2 Tax=Lacticaseibacillus TaxID=2759736 RepID=A0AAN1C623_LACCA|nr:MULTISPECIES: sugar phosphate isomerase/epimerase [Lacticaseibacillus]ARY90441.1 protein iolH [Lacticaseibacillus casei]KAB1969813.1 sugar phosphate isomerase/epimerase [Lacticaseibacillus casei]WLV81061.1 sugar phosphate isomerase/epimerase [Lacticaseibacillus sp. NCIMB 15473]WNX25020.1 sugar phosphate isomerase/epimerase [Lacticaseibacillus casei]WNX27792.1 sugar phosphate isomerase/epimerase [Lacticaseibacillus casei]
MKLAYDPSMFRDTMTLKQMFDEVARLGYEYVELSPRRDFIWFYEHPVADTALIKQVKRYAQDAGVKISSVLPVQQWSSPDEQEREFAVRNLKRTIEITAALGVKVLNTEFSGDKFQPLVSQGQWYKSMEELAPEFEKNGITLEIQPHPNDFIESNLAASRLIRSLDVDWVHQVWCSSHAFYMDDGHGDIRQQFAESGDLITHVLIADTFNHKGNQGLRYIINPPGAPVTIHQHLNPGEGEVDFATLYAVLRERHFNGIITNNVFAWPDKVDWSNKITLQSIKNGLQL